MFEYEDDEDEELDDDNELESDCPNLDLPCDKCKYWDKVRSRCKYKDVEGIF